jgi:uncharacterized protein
VTTAHKTIDTAPDAEVWRQAVDCFEIRDWWMTHELLELLWRRHKGTPRADLCQGLLQAAVCLHHYGNGNFSGARLLAKQAVEVLERFNATPDDWQPSFGLAAWLEDFRECVQPLLDDNPGLKPLHPTEIPHLWLDDTMPGEGA